MDFSEVIAGVLLIILLLGLAGFYSWRQLGMLRRLGTETSFSHDERVYLRRQAWRRLVCSSLMVIFAAWLIGSYFFEEGLGWLHDVSVENKSAGQSPKPDAEQKEFIFIYSAYLILGILLFFGILSLAAIDLFATRRFTLRQLKQMRDSHQAMLEQQTARLRSERNGHG